MAERITIDQAQESPWDPKLRLARIFQKRDPSLQIQREIFFDIGIMDVGVGLDNQLRLTVDPAHTNVVEIWQRVARTKDFSILQEAIKGNTNFFRDEEISGDELIIPQDEKGFLRFYHFTRALAYQRGMEETTRWGTLDELKDLRLEARKGWVPTFSLLQKNLASHYVNSLLGRLYSLVTTGEERKSPWDAILDKIY